jgi:hypothetical protein
LLNLYLEATDSCVGRAVHLQGNDGGMRLVGWLASIPGQSAALASLTNHWRYQDTF